MTRLKHLLMVLAILVPAFASAQAEVPDYSRLTAEHHPRLFLDNQEFEAMKSLIGSGTSSYLSDLHDIIMEICRLDAMKDSPLEYKLDASDKRILHVSRDALTRIFFCAYAYRYTGEQIYLEHAEKTIRTVCGFKDWNAGKHFLDTVHLQRAHAFVKPGGEQLRDTGMFLNLFLQRVGANQQFVQTNPPLVTRAATGIAASGAIQREHAILGVVLEPFLIDGLGRRFRVFLP